MHATTSHSPIAVHARNNAFRILMGAFLTILLVACLVEPAYAAGTGGGEFKTIYETFQGWVKGYLGKLIALFAFVVGIFYGAIKQNFMMALGGVGIAIMIAVMPTLLETLIGAVV